MLDRRNFMKTCSGMGLAGTLFPGVLWAQAQAQGAKKITRETIENAAAIAGCGLHDRRAGGPSRVVDAPQKPPEFIRIQDVGLDARGTMQAHGG